MLATTRLLILFLTLLGFAPAVWAQVATPADHAGWLSVIPAGVAISAALILRAVLPALFLGVWLGAWAIAGLDLSGIGSGLLDSFEVYIRDAVADRDHVAIILFSLMIGGLINIISRIGGTSGLVKGIVQWIRTRRDGQLATVAMGLVLFVDDYANTLVVGNTMRPITDQLRISREKLAYLVDATAAPVAAVAVVTTWIGYELGLVDQALRSIEAPSTEPFLLLLSSIAFSFYPFLCVVLLLIVCWTGRDIGPMVAAERRATEGAEPHDLGNGAAAGNDERHHAINAIVPILVLVGGICLGIVVTGDGENLREVVGSADTYASLMWASLVAVVVAITMSLAQKLATLNELIEYWSDGARSLLVPMTIVVLAWALAAVSNELGTADFIVSIIGDWLPVSMLPAVVFVAAALIAFATGAAWGTMAILIPLAVPLAFTLLGADGQMDSQILPASVAAVLAGAVFGDHCSPISDTTVMSSMASGCDHIEHVRTQLPYALLAGSAALIFGFIPAGLGIPWWLSLATGAVVLVLTMRVIGVRVKDNETSRISSAVPQQVRS